METQTAVSTCFQGTVQDLEPLFNEAYRLTRRRFPNEIHFYSPGMVRFETSFHTATEPYRFPGISVTGRRCSLNCDHCRGNLLQSMIPAPTPQRLMELCTLIKHKGGKGCLISGGCLEDGSVPLMDFVPTIGRVKRELGLDVVVHCGLVRPELAEALADVDIDAALIDVIGSNDTIKMVCHIDWTVESFDRSLLLLRQKDIPIVPHIVVGLHYGEIRGEETALEIVSKHDPAAVVIVALMPLEGTPMEHTSTVQPIDIARVILASKFKMPNVPLILGCARPRGQHKSETDVLAIRSGVNAIAYPSEEAYSFAKTMGLDIRSSDECCALLWKDLHPKDGTTPESVCE